MTELTGGPSQSHVYDEIPGLLDGSASKAVVQHTIEHLRSCQECEHELLNALLAHASLSSAAHTAPTLRSSDSEPPAAEDVEPDWSVVFAKFDAEDHDQSTSPVRARSGRRTSRWLTIAAAAVGIGVGASTVAALHHSGHRQVAATTVQLAAYDVGTSPATATMAGDDMSVNAITLPDPASGSLYEVWLTNTARTKMHSLGWIDTNGKGSFTVPAQLLEQYSAIEVSVQKISAGYDYSGTSVLRGSY